MSEQMENKYKAVKKLIKSGELSRNWDTQGDLYNWMSENDYPPFSSLSPKAIAAKWDKINTVDV